MKVTFNIISAALAIFLFSGLAYPEQTADSVLVLKSESRLYLMRDGKELTSFKVAFGANPDGHKQQQGDERTPEGHYILDYKNPDSKYYKSIHISYPNALDRENARKRGVRPGGDIMIHGQPNNPTFSQAFYAREDWTNGCIAVSNSDMIDIWLMTPDSVPIEIVP